MFRPWVKLGHPIRLFEYLLKTYGKIAHYRFMGTPIVFLNDPTTRGTITVDAVLGHPLVAGTWQQVVVPLTSVANATGLVQDIYVQDDSGTDQPPVYLDDIQLDDKAGTTPTMCE